MIKATDLIQIMLWQDFPKGSYIQVIQYKYTLANSKYNKMHKAKVYALTHEWFAARLCDDSRADVLLFQHIEKVLIWHFKNFPIGVTAADPISDLSDSLSLLRDYRSHSPLRFQVNNVYLFRYWFFETTNTALLREPDIYYCGQWKGQTCDEKRPNKVNT